MSRLLEIFRPNKRAVWQQLCEEIGADFIPGKGFRGKDAIQAYYKNWVIIIDTYKRGKRPTVTRIKAPYVNRDSFHFRIFRRGAVSGIRKRMGLQDVIIGHEDFDRKFIIQGNDERKLKMMFDNELIRHLIDYQRQIDLEVHLDEDWVTDEFGEGVSELYFEVKGIISHLDILHALYELFAEVLNHLCHIGSAYEDDPYLVAD